MKKTQLHIVFFSLFLLLGINKINAAEKKVANITLAQFLNGVSAKHKVYFTYNTAQASNTTINPEEYNFSLLDRIIYNLEKNTKFNFEYLGNKYYAVYKKKTRRAKINKIKTNSFNQIKKNESYIHFQNTVHGKVTDNSGKPLAGVNIIKKGTSKGTSTDFDGNYSINATNGTTLLFSYIGYKTKEITVKSYNIDITLTEGMLLDGVQVVGSRSPNRTAIDTPVPVDILDVAEITSSTGKVEINDILQYAAPSFNATKQSGSDGADHIVPASLRGLGPDQTLILINGKRRHQSSLVNIFGTRGRGNSGTDLNAIPSSAIKRIEVLRDGASAQYGSDAIAGVINIVLKNNTNGFTGGITYGAYSTAVGGNFTKEIFETQDGWQPELYNIEGKNRLDGKSKSFDGETVKIDANYGLKISENGGYINISTEFLSKEKTLRPSYSWRKGYGSAGIEGFNLMLNSSIPIHENTEFYAFGGRNYRNTNANAFSRNSFEDGDNRSVPSIYPDGFTPQITSIITDISASVGVRHTTNNNWNIDFNNTYGKNNFHYYIKNSNNASLKDASPIDFDAGGHFLTMNTTGLDFNKYFDNIAAGLNIAYGFEFRNENFGIFSGEEASYALYDENGVPITNPAIQSVAQDSNGNNLPGGSQGFPGYSPANEVDRSRTNYGIYLDADINASKDFMLGGALRYEDYSDFGNTFNFKIASRYKIGDNFALRGSLSSGFRAPSLAQLYYNLEFTNIVTDTSIPSLLSANNSPVTKAFGINQLNEEKAFNTSIGFTFNYGGFSATVDAYSINVDDRIILTDNFTDPLILDPLDVDAAQFFANGVDTKTTGLDIVLEYETIINDKSKFKAAIIGNLNKLEIKEIHNEDLNKFTFFGPLSQAYLKAAAPDYKFGLNLGFTNKKFNANLNFTQFSQVEIQDFQWVNTPATTQAEADALYITATDIYDTALVTDLSLGYNFSEKFKLTVGANNLFNVYPTEQFDGWTDQGGFADSVQMGSDGMYLFSRLNFSF